MPPDVLSPARHPARYTPAVLAAIGNLLPAIGCVLDPFAGTGLIHELATATRHTIGVEIEPEWAHQHADTIVGNALDLEFDDDTFDALATSPTYGNRMADHHDARDGSKRNTYRHTIGRPLHGDNSGQLQWGRRYQAFHEQAWAEADRVLRPGGVFVLSVSDHIRGGKRMPVTQWHVSALGALGFEVERWVDVETPRNRFGANAALRVEAEHVIRLVRR